MMSLFEKKNATNSYSASSPFKMFLHRDSLSDVCLFVLGENETS